jgi:hypothetical protein
MLGRQGAEVIDLTQRQPGKRRQLVPNVVPPVHGFPNDAMIDFADPLLGNYPLGRQPIALQRTPSGHIIVERQNPGGWQERTQHLGVRPSQISQAYPGQALIDDMQRRASVPSMPPTEPMVFQYRQPQNEQGGQQQYVGQDKRIYAQQMRYAPAMSSELHLPPKFVFDVPSRASVPGNRQPQPMSQSVYTQPTTRAYSQQITPSARPAPSAVVPVLHSHPPTTHRQRQNTEPRPPLSHGYNVAGWRSHSPPCPSKEPEFGYQLPPPSPPVCQSPEREMTDEEIDAVLDAWAKKIAHVEEFGGVERGWEWLYPMVDEDKKLL